MSVSSSRVVWLSAETPDQDGGGGQRRQYHQIRALVEAGARVHVASLAGPQDDTTVRALAPVERFAPPRLRGLRPDPALDGLLRRERFDAAIVAHIESVPHVARALARQRLPWLLDLHNVNSRWHRARGERMDAARWALRERAALWRAAMATVCSREERAAVARVAPGAWVEVAGHGVDPGEWPVQALAGERAPSIAFFGAWSHGPNVAGAQWLVGRVWPRVRAAVPAAELLLAGPGEPPRGLLKSPGVRHLGRVAELAQLLGSVRVVAVPIIEGIGARMKFGEALAGGAAVVSTSTGAEGFDAEGAFVRADSEDGFARACTELLLDPGRARAVAEAGRRWALERCLWSQTSVPIITFVRELVHR